MNIIKSIKALGRQREAYNKGLGLFGRLYGIGIPEAQANRIARNSNRYRNFAMGRVHCTKGYN